MPRLDEVMQDLRVSLRGLVRSPAMTLTIVLTVGIGIGATTAIFAAVDAALLRPLPYADPGRLVRIYTDAPPNRFRFSVVDYRALEAQQHHFERIAGYTQRAVAFSDGTVAERVQAKEVSWTYFGLLGIGPALGRDFAAPDGVPGNPRAVLVSHAFWQRRLGGRPNAVGSVVRLDGSDHTVAGVLPAVMGPLERGYQLFVAAQWPEPRRKGPFFVVVLGRLRSDVTRAAAADELRAINRRLFPLWRSSYQDDRATWGMMDLHAYIVGDVQGRAGLALGAVALVWLIACTNASSLLVARVTSRHRELAVRAALGASRFRVIRHLLAESSLLAIAATAVGIGVAWLAIGVLRDLGADYFPRTQEISIDGHVLQLLALVTVMSALLFGIVPAVQGTGGRVDESLRAASRSATANAGVRRLRRALVGTQFAVATPLLVAAGLLLATLNQLSRVDLGFDTRNLLTGAISLPATQYPEGGRVALFWGELQRRVEALPGVSGTAFADGLPPDGVGNFNNFDLEDMPAGPGQSQPVTPWVAVTPEYFRLLGLKLLDGRLLEHRDAQDEDLRSVVVDRAWAARFFPNGSAVGKRLKSGGCTECPWTTVVGVVSPVKYAGLDAPDEGSVYTPMAGRGAVLPPGAVPERDRFLLVRSTTDPAAVMPAVRQIVRDLDPALPFSSVATMGDLVDESLQRPRSVSLLVAAFAAVALVLAVIGIYGVMSYYVQQHARDISIRMALGASGSAVLRLVVGEGMRVVLIGVAIGLLASLAATRLIASMLFGVGAADATTFLVVTGLMLAIAVAACLVPAKRAVGVEPAAVLRGE